MQLYRSNKQRSYEFLWEQATFSRRLDPYKHFSLAQFVLFCILKKRIAIYIFTKSFSLQWLCFGHVGSSPWQQQQQYRPASRYSQQTFCHAYITTKWDIIRLTYGYPLEEKAARALSDRSGWAYSGSQAKIFEDRRFRFLQPVLREDL